MRMLFERWKCGMKREKGCDRGKSEEAGETAEFAGRELGTASALGAETSGCQHCRAEQRAPHDLSPSFLSEQPPRSKYLEPQKALLPLFLLLLPDLIHGDSHVLEAVPRSRDQEG